jgi:hypothetical protein
MTKKINLKTRSLYMGLYRDNFLPFVYASNASDEVLVEHFRKHVYACEYGEPLEKDAQLDVYEGREVHDYDRKKDYKITISPS